MFAGIVGGKGKVAKAEWSDNRLNYVLAFPQDLLEGLKIGASVSVDGVCQTVTSIQGHLVWFDAIMETLQKTTLNALKEGDFVNLERALKLGDEIGGHLLSGHIYGTASLISIKENTYTFQCPQGWTKYLFEKGFIAIDGVSLTLGAVDRKEGLFSVHLIPETLRTTSLGAKKPNSLLNLEFDSLTQVAVETIERLNIVK